MKYNPKDKLTVEITSDSTGGVFVWAESKPKQIKKGTHRMKMFGEEYKEELLSLVETKEGLAVYEDCKQRFERALKVKRQQIEESIRKNKGEPTEKETEKQLSSWRLNRSPEAMFQEEMGRSPLPISECKIVSVEKTEESKKVEAEELSKEKMLEAFQNQDKMTEVLAALLEKIQEDKQQTQAKKK